MNTKYLVLSDGYTSLAVDELNHLLNDDDDHEYKLISSFMNGDNMTLLVERTEKEFV